MGEWTAALLGPFLLIAVLACAAALISVVIRARRRRRQPDDPAHRPHGLAPGPERDARFGRAHE
ncbi:hypothetical protein EV188_106231 [Actinomycetospora succinea]|uniref:Uncharacterized protein n=1 Tax=Actinomycetospora succinea TaxID=663603 RepID=A0A4R6V1U2_9PSEU|nr:hypothetical protein [Actinomycetospora succinea]TDQ54084.1 hypothetical protein EV188_106231 [Actinomycetospora succinea]